MDQLQQRPLSGSGYVVTFCGTSDPQAVASNSTSGSLIGIWPTSMHAQEQSVLSRTAREMVASCMAVYGTRLTVVLAIASSYTVSSEERRVGKEWVRTCRSRWSRDH